MDDDPEPREVLYTLLVSRLRQRIVYVGFRTRYYIRI